ncbi:MAG TPA: sugar ABC transporter permease [Methylomirabilota bacterium]|nr:sugar ABC transporter permease [Methylomirabilota bacterium]
MRRRRRLTWQGARIDWAAYGFLLPFAVPFLTLTLGAALFGFYVSFTDWGIFGEPRWIGLENYQRALGDPWVGRAWLNTLRYGLFVVPGTTVVALLMALYVNQRWRGFTLARTAFYAPNVVSVTVIGLVWVWMLDTQHGLVNQALGALGVPPVPWLTSPDWVRTGIGVASIWWDAGFSMVILLAGLQDIPRELRETASLDGASAVQTIWYVTLPLLRPALSLVLTLLTIGALRVFSQIYIMTNGGPAGASGSVIFYVWEVGFAKYQLGYAAAISTLLFVTILSLTLLQLRVFRETTW